MFKFFKKQNFSIVIGTKIFENQNYNCSYTRTKSLNYNDVKKCNYNLHSITITIANLSFNSALLNLNYMLIIKLNTTTFDRVITKITNFKLASKW